MNFTAIIPLFFGLRGAQFWIIAGIALFIFGTARLPFIMRNLGKGVHQFKQGVEEAKAEMNKPVKSAEQITREQEEEEQSIKTTAKVKDTDGPNE